MKKWLVVALVACVAAGVQAADGTKEDSAKKKAKNSSISKDQFLKQMKKDVEKVGDVFDPAKAEAEFKKLDKNSDGKLTGKEMPKKGKKTSGKDQAEATAEDAAKTADPAVNKKGAPKPVTQEMYVANQKKMAEKKGVEFDQAAAEAKFTTMDKNKDGVLTGDEVQKRKGATKEKNKAKSEETTSDSDE
jgi:Ca2+-binding EF-hand superfamily protein